MFIFFWFLLFIFLSILMVIILLELTRVNPDRNIFSINVELTSTFVLYRGLVHRHHRILDLVIDCIKCFIKKNHIYSNVLTLFIKEKKLLIKSEKWTPRFNCLKGSKPPYHPLLGQGVSIYQSINLFMNTWTLWS